MNNQDEVLRIIEHEAMKPNVSREYLILLKASAHVNFTGGQLYSNFPTLCNLKTVVDWDKEVDRLKPAFKRCLKNRYIVEVGKHKDPHARIYEITEKGISKLPVDIYSYIQILVDNSSEEVNSSDDQSSTEHIVTTPPEAVIEYSDSEKIIGMCDYLKETLLSKNKSYGNSSLKPIGVFDLPRTAKVQSRMEDKISRLAQVSRGSDKDALRDTLLDLAGYSILYLIILEEEEQC